MRKDLNPDYLPAGHPWRELGRHACKASHAPPSQCWAGSLRLAWASLSFSETRAVGALPSQAAAEGVRWSLTAVSCFQKKKPGATVLFLVSIQNQVVYDDDV